MWSFDSANAATTDSKTLRRPVMTVNLSSPRPGAAFHLVGYLVQEVEVEHSGALQFTGEVRELLLHDGSEARDEEVGEPELVDAPPLPVVPCLVGIRDRGRVAFEHGHLVPVGSEQQGSGEPADSGAGDDDVHGTLQDASVRP